MWWQYQLTPQFWSLFPVSLCITNVQGIILFVNTPHMKVSINYMFREWERIYSLMWISWNLLRQTFMKTFIYVDCQFDERKLVPLSMKGNFKLATWEVVFSIYHSLVKLREIQLVGTLDTVYKSRTSYEPFIAK